MIRPLCRFYKKAPNGKQELFGIDGAEHTLISSSVMVVTKVVSEIVTYAFQLHPLVPTVSMGVAWFVMRAVWFFIELSQERDMLEVEPNRVDYGLKFWKWTKARKVDMGYPFIGDTIAVMLLRLI